MMPKIDGWQVCKEIRQHSDLPIIMLTAKGMKKMSLLALNLEWMNIYLSHLARKFLWQGWRLSFVEHQMQVMSLYQLVEFNLTNLPICED